MGEFCAKHSKRKTEAAELTGDSPFVPEEVPKYPDDNHILETENENLMGVPGSDSLQQADSRSVCRYDGYECQLISKVHVHFSCQSCVSGHARLFHTSALLCDR